MFITKRKLTLNGKVESTRDGFGRGILALGRQNKRVVVLSADLVDSTRVDSFAKKFPERFFNVGVAEQNMIGLAAGLAQEGFIPYCTSFAAFSPGRNWEQIRVSVCYNRANVKIVSSHAGISVGEDGATHQALEDLALTQVLPRLLVVTPCDANEAAAATIAISQIESPCYLRLSRYPTPLLTEPKETFHLGRARKFVDGRDLTILTHGTMVWPAIEAAKKLRDKFSIEVISLSTLKPLDQLAIVASLQKTRRALVVEESEQFGGLFSAVAGLVVEKLPSEVHSLAVGDSFGQSGKAEDLLAVYDLTSDGIIKKILKIMS